MAGGVTLGFLKYVLGFDSIQFRKGMTDAERGLVSLQKSFEKKGRQLTELGKGLTAFVTLPIAGIAAAGIKEAQETQQAMAQVNASLASMGPVAGRSAKQLQDFANALELKSTFEADEILRRVTANMLTFGNVSGQAFDRAQQAAVDLATRLGTDLQSATILVGKALNDPIKGLTALGRAGIQFSESQKTAIKAMVETGNTAGAQAIILGELERQFKGSAAAAANTDPLNQANKAWKQMAETVGTALLPILPVFANAVVSVANAFTSLPAGVQQTILVMAGVAAAVGPVLIGFGGLIKLVAGIGPAVTALSAAWTALKAGMLAARLAAITTLPALLPFLIPLAAIAAAVGVAYLAWKNWDKIKAIVSSVYAAVKTYLVDRFSAVVASVKAKVDAVIGFFHNLWDKLVGHSYVPDTVDAIQQHFGRLGEVMVAPAQKATAATTASFKKLKDDVSSLLDQLFPEEAEFRDQMNKLQLLDEAAKRGLISTEKLAAARGRVGGVGDAFQVSPDIANPKPVEQLPGGFDDSLTNAATMLPQVISMTQAWNKELLDVSARGLNSIADGIGAWATGQAKLSDVFRQTLQAMTAELISFTVRYLMLQAIKAAFGAGSDTTGFFSQAFGFGGARASGGPVLGGTAYLVGERGPEIFMPSGSGRIVANDRSRGMLGGGNSLSVNVSLPPGMRSEQGRATGHQIGLGIREQMRRTSTR